MVKTTSGLLLAVISALCLYAVCGCGGGDDYYQGKDRRIAGACLGVPIPDQATDVWLQKIVPSDYKIVVLIAKIGIQQPIAESYCRKLGLSPAPVEAALMSSGAIDDRDRDVVLRWWTPPTVLEVENIKVSYSFSRPGIDGSNSTLKAIWFDGYLYLFKRGPIGKL